MIKKDEFQAYQDYCKMSKRKITSFDLPKMKSYTGVPLEKLIEIFNNYELFNKRFGG